MRSASALGAVVLAAFVAACTTTPSVAPTSAATAAATAAGTALPTTVPTPTSAATSSAPSPCAFAAQTPTPPSDRLVGLTLVPGAASDVVRLRFGAPAGGQASASLRIAVATPPFAMAGSGQPVTVAGDRFLEIAFEGMSIMDAQGNPTFSGSRDVTGTGSIAEVVNTDMSEGYVYWVVGIRGTGCVTVATVGSDELDITVAH